MRNNFFTSLLYPLSYAGDASQKIPQAKRSSWCTCPSMFGRPKSWGLGVTKGNWDKPQFQNYFTQVMFQRSSVLSHLANRGYWYGPHILGGFKGPSHSGHPCSHLWSRHFQAMKFSAVSRILRKLNSSMGPIWHVGGLPQDDKCCSYFWNLL